MSPAVTQLSAIFVAEVEALITRDAAAKARELVLAQFDQFDAAARGFRAAAKVLTFPGGRRKAPVQLCPAPGCGNRAAPAYAMLCGVHKGAPKATVRGWRAERQRRQRREIGRV